VYEIGIYPDWWKLEPQSTAAAWQACADVIAREDDLCRGIVVLGLDAPLEQLIGSLRLAASAPLVRGFAVGRTIFGRAAEGFLSGQMSEEQAIADMSDRFATLVAAWNSK
jgi:5-dehydro-2-deoxygluconokinase